MCYKQPNHIVFFKPYRDTHGIERVFTCTIWDKTTNDLAKGCAILSLDDTFNREVGKQLSYNKAARALNGRDVHPIVTHKAWEAIQALDPTEMRDFFKDYASWTEDNGSLCGGFKCNHDDLTPSDMLFLSKRGYKAPSVLSQIVMNDLSECIYATNALKSVHNYFNVWSNDDKVSVKLVRHVVNQEIERINS